LNSLRYIPKDIVRRWLPRFNLNKPSRKILNVPVPSPTEDTITALLAEELEKRGVKAQPFAKVRIPGVGLRKPDIWCENAGAYPIEAKFSEDELQEALSKIYHDYLPDPSVEGGFAIIYPRELSKPLPKGMIEELSKKLKFKLAPIFRPEDRRKGFRFIEGTLPEVADILAEFILTPPEYVEPSISDIIHSLRDAATRITIALRRLAGADLEDLFGGKDVFRNILQYEERKYPVEDLRLAAAYILVNQLLFYHVLSRARPDLFPELDPKRIRSSPDLTRLYFNRVLDVNYRAVLSYDVASRVPSEYLQLIRNIIGAIKAIAPEKVGGDLLGTIFHDLVPFETRKSIAAFYTNILSAELLAWLAIDRHDIRVADLAVGSGGLLVAAYRRKRFLLEQVRRFTREDHRRFVEEDLLGIDVMPFAANVAACHLALQAPEYPTNKVKIAIWDSTELVPGVKIPPIAALKAVLRGQARLEAFARPAPEVKGVVSLREEIPEEIPLERYDVIIMNPPFTRQERIPEDYKKVLFERFSDYEDYLHGQLGYYGYFVFLADRFLKESGRMALVLPATILRIRSCEGIRRLLAERYHIEHIITTWHRSAFSESVRFREILLVARKIKPTSDSKTVITVLKRLPSTLTEAREITDVIMRSQADWEDDRMLMKVRDHSELTADTSNWFKYIALSDPSLVDLYKNLMSKGSFIPLASLTDIIRGYELRGGAVTRLIVNAKRERAIKSGDVWILSNLDEEHGYATFEHRFIPALRFKIPLSATKKTLRRAAGVDTIDVTSELDFIIVSSWDDHEFSDFMEATGVRLPDKVFNSIKRDVENRLGNLFIVRRLDLSAPRTHALAFYSLINAAPTKLLWSLKLPDEQAKLLALYLNSTINLLQTLLLRVETRGAFIELSKYILSNFLVPDIQKLNSKAKEQLLSIFAKVKNVKLPSILEQLRAILWVSEEPLEILEDLPSFLEISPRLVELVDGYLLGLFG